MVNKEKSLEHLKQIGEAPEWLLESGYKTLCGGYLLPNETPKGMWERVSKASAARLNKPELAEKFFDLFWKNWLCGATPVLANMGAERSLPISCYSLACSDSCSDIMLSMHELAIMTKNAGGVGVHWNAIRPRGSKISKNNGVSDGVIPFIKIQDSTTIGIAQGTRRGATAAYLPIDHGDIKEFLKIRRPIGDANRQCLNIHHAVCITDEFIKKVEKGDSEARELWKEILKARLETGEPFIFFSDAVNKQNPESYKKLGLDVKGSNICCVSGDTLVLTKNGPIEIKELCGKTVEIWDGKNWVQNSSFEERGIDELIRIQIKDGSYVDVNANHRWFVASSYNDIRENRYKKTLAQDLKVGQWIEHHSVEVHGNKNINGAYLKGFLIADGTHTKDRPQLNLHSTKYCCEESLINSANEISNGLVRTNVIKEVSFSNEHDYTDKGKAFGAQKLKNMRGLSLKKSELLSWATDYKKDLPDDIFAWSRDSKLKFLAGLFDGDGTVSEKSPSLQISSIHKNFINKLQLLIKTFGYSANVDIIDVVDVKLRSNKSYRLSISSFDAYNLLSEMPTCRLKCFNKKPNRKLTGWRRITSITKLDGKHSVYCPILPTTGKFGLANGLITGNTEITLHTDENHSFVCCLSSLNLARWDEWKNTDTVQLSVWFLDGVMQEFIDKAKNIFGMEKAVRFAEKSRALGLGVLAWHTLLQKKMLPFDSFDTFKLNNEIFKHIRDEAEIATKELYKVYGAPEWCNGFERRNTHLISLAPTVSNSIISGEVSPSIEPWSANAFARKTAKGMFIHKNKQLENLLEQKGQNNDKVWSSIVANDGSVLHLDFLTQEEKEVFLTAREINQFTILKLAEQRQKYIDQGQSINLFFSSDVSPKQFHEIHWYAAKSGVIKTLYYCRSQSVLKGSSGTKEYKREMTEDGCKACEG